MLPEGWNREELGTVASFASGNTPSKQNTAYWGGDMPWISAKDLKRPVMCNSIDTLSDDGAAVAKLASPGSVLILVRGMTLLKDIPVALAGRRVAFNQDVKCLSGRRGVENRYLALALTAKKRAIMRLVNTANHGTGRLDTDLLKSLLIEFPNSAEQQKIVELVSTWDQAIETVDKLIETARAQKKALMQQLLTGKRRLPGFERGWERVSLGEVANILVSNVDKKNVTGERAVQLCNYMDVYRATEIVAGTHYMVATATSAQIGKFGLRGGDVLITKDSETPADIAVSAFVPEDNPGLVCGYHLAIIRPQQAGIGRFLKYVFDLPDVRNYFASRANGATRFGLTIDAITSAPIQLPSQDECRAVAEVIKFADADVASLTGQRNHLEIEKRALMQQLLTGKRRVKLEEMA